jgi:hypothetical protein
MSNHNIIANAHSKLWWLIITIFKGRKNNKLRLIRNKVNRLILLWFWIFIIIFFFVFFQFLFKRQNNYIWKAIRLHILFYVPNHRRLFMKSWRAVNLNRFLSLVWIYILFFHYFLTSLWWIVFYILFL